jgi:hypothetical protein
MVLELTVNKSPLPLIDSKVEFAASSRKEQRPRVLLGRSKISHASILALNRTLAHAVREIEHDIARFQQTLAIVRGVVGDTWQTWLRTKASQTLGPGAEADRSGSTGEMGEMEG